MSKEIRRKRTRRRRREAKGTKDVILKLTDL